MNSFLVFGWFISSNYTQIVGLDEEKREFNVIFFSPGGELGVCQNLPIDKL
jgi:hypothetical protein